MTKEKCELCKNEFPSYTANTTRTSDNKIICVSCYDEVSQELFKGIFSVTEATDTERFLKMFRQITLEYLNTMKKHEIYTKRGVTEEGEFLGRLREAEEVVAGEEFGVTRQVMVFSKREHLKLIRKVLNSYLQKIYPKSYNKDLSNILISSDYNLGSKDILNNYLSMRD